MNNLLSTVLLITILLVGGTAFGQSGDRNSFTISGQVIDAQLNKPLEYTTVSIHNKADSSLVTGNITAVDGKFSIEVPEGNYWLQVQFISYETKTINNVVVDKNNPSVNVGVIKLSPDTETLSEVVVSGEKNQMEMSLDKRVFNVEKMLTTAGGNAAEILDNVPSVSVDVEGNVSLRGSQNVRILVNGKPSGLVGISSTEALRQLPGDLIERIEVITNPSARYDAEGMAGIINIILKKDHRKGINGSVNLNTGLPANYGASFDLNVRRKWFNLFGNYGINYRETPGKGTSFDKFFNQDTTYFTNRTSDRVRSGMSHNFRIGADFYINDHNTITASGLYRLSGETNNTDITYSDLNSLQEVVRETVRKEEEKEDEDNMEFSLNYTRTFEKEEQKFTADVQYRESSEIENATQLETVYGEFTEEHGPDSFQRTFNDESDNSLLLQADYIHPFGEEGKFEAGYRSTFRKIETDYSVDTLNENEAWINLSEFTNHFNYDEKIYAVYGIYGNKKKRFSYQLGLRAELTDILSQLEETNEQFNKSYLNLFPSAHITYELKNSNSVQASFSRRIRRPGFWWLNPFQSITDDRNIRTGNPDLDPEFTNSYELGYLKNWETASLFASLYYRSTQDVMQRVRTYDAVEERTITRPENLGVQDSYGIEANLSKDIARWWQVNSNLNFYREMTEGNSNGEDLSSDTYTMSGRLSSKLTFWKKINYQLSLFYMAPAEMPQGRRKSMYSLDMGLSKDIFAGKGTVTLSVRDLLNSRKWRSETTLSDYYSNSEFQWRSRQFLLSFTYRLNDFKKDRQQNNNGFEGGEEMEF